MEGARPDSLDCSAVVRNHVFRASHNFLYSKFREEVTRHSNAVLEYRYNAALSLKRHRRLRGSFASRRIS